MDGNLSSCSQNIFESYDESNESQLRRSQRLLDKNFKSSQSIVDISSQTFAFNSQNDQTASLFNLETYKGKLDDQDRKKIPTPPKTIEPFRTQNNIPGKTNSNYHTEEPIQGTPNDLNNDSLLKCYENDLKKEEKTTFGKRRKSTSKGRKRCYNRKSLLSDSQVVETIIIPDTQHHWNKENIGPQKNPIHPFEDGKNVILDSQEIETIILPDTQHELRGKYFRTQKNPLQNRGNQIQQSQQEKNNLMINKKRKTELDCESNHGKILRKSPNDERTSQTLAPGTIENKVPKECSAVVETYVDKVQKIGSDNRVCDNLGHSISKFNSKEAHSTTFDDFPHNSGNELPSSRVNRKRKLNFKTVEPNIKSSQGVPPLNISQNDEVNCKAAKLEKTLKSCNTKKPMEPITTLYSNSSQLENSCSNANQQGSQNSFVSSQKVESKGRGRKPKNKNTIQPKKTNSARSEDSVKIPTTTDREVYVIPKVQRYYPYCPPTTQSLLPAVYPPHFIHQIPEATSSNALPIECPERSLKSESLPLISSFLSYLTPEYSETILPPLPVKIESSPTPPTPTLSPSSWPEIFEIEELEDILNVRRTLYYLNELHVKVLAVILNRNSNELFDTLDKIVELDENILQNFATNSHDNTNNQWPQNVTSILTTNSTHPVAGVNS